MLFRIYFHPEDTAPTPTPTASPSHAPSEAPKTEQNKAKEITQQELLTLLTSNQLKELKDDVQINDGNALYSLRYAQFKHLVESGKPIHTDSTKRTELSAAQRDEFLKTLETLVKDPAQNKDTAVMDSYKLLQNVIIGNQELLPDAYKVRIAEKRIIGAKAVEENEEVVVEGGEGDYYHPVQGGMTVTEEFGARGGHHAGMDLAAHMGVKVVAWTTGKVVYAGWMGGYGYCIDIQHKNGLKTRYGHLSAIHVKVGDTVNAGAHIGNVGSTGHSTGPHLHFEVHRHGSPENPRIESNKYGLNMSKGGTKVVSTPETSQVAENNKDTNSIFNAA